MTKSREAKADSPREIMVKTVVKKEDGRQLIMYSFKSAAAEASQQL